MMRITRSVHKYAEITPKPAAKPSLARHQQAPLTVSCRSIAAIAIMPIRRKHARRGDGDRRHDDSAAGSVVAESCPAKPPAEQTRQANIGKW